MSLYLFEFSTSEKYVRLSIILKSNTRSLHNGKFISLNIIVSVRISYVKAYSTFVGPINFPFPPSENTTVEHSLNITVTPPLVIEQNIQLPKKKSVSPLHF